MLKDEKQVIYISNPTNPKVNDMSNVVVADSHAAALIKELFGDLSSFIETKHINKEKVRNYEHVLDLLAARRDHWALSRDLAPIDSLKVYGAYSTAYNTLYGVAKRLNLGIVRQENPKAAKEVYGIVSETTELVAKLEKIDAQKDKAQVPSWLIGDVFEASRRLRRQAISNQLIQAGEVPNQKELSKELLAVITANHA